MVRQWLVIRRRDGCGGSLVGPASRAGQTGNSTPCALHAKSRGQSIPWTHPKIVQNPSRGRCQGSSNGCRLCNHLMQSASDAITGGSQCCVEEGARNPKMMSRKLWPSQPPCVPTATEGSPVNLSKIIIMIMLLSFTV